MYFFEFKTPGKVICVNGGAGKLGKTVDNLGCSRVMFVTDESIRKAGLVDYVAAGLEKADIGVAGVYDGVKPDPRHVDIEACTAMARELKADGLISVGGGSAIDTAKATLIMLTEPGELMEYVWAEYSPSKPLLPHVAVPTTAGTGSEATHVTMITDVAAQRKVFFIGPDLMPRVSVLDPVMTASMPPALTASTGMDALSHAIEAIHSIWHQPMTDGFSLSAVDLVNRYLEQCFSNGDDLFARMNMLLAANMAGCSAGNSFVCIVHAAGHTIGSLYNVPHGVSVGLMLPYSMELNLRFEEVPAQYRKVAVALGLKVDDDDDVTASRRGIERIREIAEAVGLPARLRDIGVDSADLEKLAQHAAEDKSMLVSPGYPGIEELRELFDKAY